MISRMPKWIGDWLESATGPRLTVAETAYLTPAVRQIRFEGNISKMHFVTGGASVIRVSETEYRNYTVARYDIAKGMLEMIFHIHGNGPGSRYIDGLQPGDALYISSARGRKEYEPSVKRQFIFGDETSLGLACSFLPGLKKNNHQFHYCFELDEQNMDAPRLLGLEPCTVFPRNGSFSNEAWLRELPLLKSGEWQDAGFILTGNARSVQAFRKVLKEMQVRGKISAKGYWLEGKKGL